MLYDIEKSRFLLVNTDPQRRCYNGCHYKSEIQQQPWEWLELEIPEKDIESRLKFWRELNEYAVSQRGERAKILYRKVESKPRS